MKNDTKIQKNFNSEQLNKKMYIFAAKKQNKLKKQIMEKTFTEKLLERRMKSCVYHTKELERFNWCAQEHKYITCHKCFDCEHYDNKNQLTLNF